MSVVADRRTELFHAQIPATVTQKTIATKDLRDNSAQIRSLLARHFLCWEGIPYMVVVHKACIHFWRAVKLWLCVSARLFWQVTISEWKALLELTLYSRSSSKTWLIVSTADPLSLKCSWSGRRAIWIPCACAFLLHMHLCLFLSIMPPMM